MTNIKTKQPNNYYEEESPTMYDQKIRAESDYAWSQNDETSHAKTTRPPVKLSCSKRGLLSSRRLTGRPRRPLPVDLPMTTPIPLQQEPQLYSAWCAKNRVGPVQALEYQDYDENSVDGCDSILDRTLSTVASSSEDVRNAAAEPQHRLGVPTSFARQDRHRVPAARRPSLRCIPTRPVRPAGKKTSSSHARHRHHMGDQYTDYSEDSMADEVGYPVQAHVSYAPSETGVGARRSRRSHGKIVIPLDVCQQPFPPRRVHARREEHSTSAQSRKADDQSRDSRSQRSSKSHRKPRSRCSHVSSSSVDDGRARHCVTAIKSHHSGVSKGRKPSRSSSCMDQVPLPDRSSLDDLLTFYENVFGPPGDLPQLTADSDSQNAETDNRKTVVASKPRSAKNRLRTVKLHRLTSDMKLQTSLTKLQCLAKSYRKLNADLKRERGTEKRRKSDASLGKSGDNQGGDVVDVPSLQDRKSRIGGVSPREVLKSRNSKVCSPNKRNVKAPSQIEVKTRSNFDSRPASRDGNTNSCKLNVSPRGEATKSHGVEASYENSHGGDFEPRPFERYSPSASSKAQHPSVKVQSSSSGSRTMTSESCHSSALDAAGLVDGSWAASMLSRQPRSVTPQRLDPRQIPAHLLKPKVPSWLSLDDTAATTPEDELKRGLQDMMRTDMEVLLQNCGSPSSCLEGRGSSQLVMELEEDNQKELEKLLSDIAATERPAKQSAVESPGGYQMDPRVYFEQIYEQQRLINVSTCQVEHNAINPFEEISIRELVRKGQETLGHEMRGESKQDLEAPGLDVTSEKHSQDQETLYKTEGLEKESPSSAEQTARSNRSQRRRDTFKEFCEKTFAAAEEMTPIRDDATQIRNSPGFKPWRLETVIEEAPQIAETPLRDVLKEFYEKRAQQNEGVPSREKSTKTSSVEEPGSSLEEARRNYSQRRESIKQLFEERYCGKRESASQETAIKPGERGEPLNLAPPTVANNKGDSHRLGVLHSMQINEKAEIQRQAATVKKSKSEEKLMQSNQRQDARIKEASQAPTGQEQRTLGALVRRAKGLKTRNSEIRRIVKSRVASRGQRTQPTSSHRSIARLSASRLVEAHPTQKSSQYMEIPCYSASGSARGSVQQDQRSTDRGYSTDSLPCSQVKYMDLSKHYGNPEMKKTAASSNVRDNEVRELWRYNEEKPDVDQIATEGAGHELKAIDSYEDWITMSERAGSTAASTTNSMKSSGNNSFASYGNRAKYHHGRDADSSVFDADELDASDAVELAPTESYIEQRVDKVFSEHFQTESNATITSEPRTMDVQRKKSFIEMSIEQAIDLIKRQASKIEEGLCMEITRSLTDKLIECDCAKEEKRCLQQIQRLRHEHLQHIRREVMHLQNVEGALDEFEQNTKIKSPSTIRWKNPSIEEE